MSEVGIFVDFGSTYTKVTALMGELLLDSAAVEDVIDELEPCIIAFDC